MRGLPISWNPVIVTTDHDDFSGVAVWSPCSRFIAITKSKAVEVLDAATLERLNAFKPPQDILRSWPIFSPDGRILTLFGRQGLTSCDLQTGRLVSALTTAESTDFPFPKKFSSFAYSVDGRVIAALDTSYGPLPLISTYDLLSGTNTGPFWAPEGRIVNPIWTHGEYLRFVTLKPGSITVWEVSFALGHTLATVQSFPAPECTPTLGGSFLFFPTLCQLAFTVESTVFIWDAQNSRFLLESGFTLHQQTITFEPWMSFSSDGGFFACTIGSPEVHVWKKSAAGYILHQKLELPRGSTVAILSPNGESIIAAGGSMIRLWHTRDQILSLPSAPARENGRDFVLAFSQNELSVAYARSWGNIVTVLDLRSDDLRLIIDAGVQIRCLGVTGSLVAVAGEGRVITWNLPAEGRVNARASIDDSVYATTLLDCSDLHSPTEQSISPDLTRVAIEGYTFSSTRLQIHDTASGRRLACTEPPGTSGSVALDECGVWWMYSKELTKGWKIIEDRESLTTKPEPLETTACPPRVFPWQSRRGYEVTDDGWVLSPTQKRLLWLPHHWRSKRRSRTWSGRCLGLRHSELTEPVILEFFE